MLVCLIFEFFHPQFFIPTSCGLRRNPQGEEEPPAPTDPLLVFAAVKKMAPSPRGAMVQKFPMHACSLVSLVSANVPRMRLCSSLFVVKSTLSSNTGGDLTFQFLLKTKNKVLNTTTPLPPSPPPHHHHLPLLSQNPTKTPSSPKPAHRSEMSSLETIAALGIAESTPRFLVSSFATASTR